MTNSTSQIMGSAVIQDLFKVALFRMSFKIFPTSLFLVFSARKCPIFPSGKMPGLIELEAVVSAVDEGLGRHLLLGQGFGGQNWGGGIGSSPEKTIYKGNI